VAAVMIQIAVIARDATASTLALIAVAIKAGTKFAF